jgi:hypothetical protein
MSQARLSSLLSLSRSARSAMPPVVMGRSVVRAFNLEKSEVERPA